MKRWMLCMAALLASGSVLVKAQEQVPAPVAPPPGPAPAPEKLHAPRLRRELVSAIWRAFAGLSEKERAELLKLQREDWNAYCKKITELGEKVLAAEKQRRAELAGWVARYRDPAVGDKEKAELKVRIQEALRADYVERIRDNRRRIEEMKRRTAQMERELNRRSAETEKAVSARLEYVLKTGNLELPPPPRRHRRDGSHPMPPPQDGAAK